VIGERVCPRCADPLPAGHLRYCSLNCKNAMRRRRRRNTNPSSVRHRKRRRALRPDTAYARFRAATQHDTNLPVAEADAHQRQARQLIAAGFAAYVNRAGLVRDVALPRDDGDAGQVFAVVELGRKAQR